MILGDAKVDGEGRLNFFPLCRNLRLVVKFYHMHTTRSHTHTKNEILPYKMNEMYGKVCGMSGVLSLVTLGVYINNYKTRISQEVQHFLHK